MSSALSIYKSKLVSADDAVKMVKSGDWIDYGSNNSMPFTLDAALARRCGELHGVKVRGNLTPGPIQVIECDPSQEHFVYSTWHCGAYERKMCDEGRAFFTPMVFHNLEWYYVNFLTVDVAMLAVSPMNDEGYFSLSGACGAVSPCLKVAKKVIVEVNEAIPFICGDETTRIHVSEVDAVVESPRRELMSLPVVTPSPIDIKIAENILPNIPDGATIQLGIGGMPNALGEMLSKSDLKDLGMHTELCCDAYLSLSKAGKLTNRKKNIDPGKGVFGLVIGGRELYDWADENDGLEGRALSYVNNPHVISSIDNMISINSCLNIDLYGQVSSESAGTRQISGTGGQLDFVEGASLSKGGKSFLCMSSSYTDKSGVSHSRILPKFTGGDIITTPRTLACYIVTEYGVINLAGKSTWERADAIISIAHPDFRDELIKQAEAQKIWLPHNKR